MNKHVARVAAIVVLSLVGVSTRVFADPITLTIGLFSFDEFIPRDDTVTPSVPGTDAFNIFNFTGDQNLLDPNANTSLLFSSLSVTLTTALGDTVIPIGGAFGPGQVLDPITFGPLFALQFAEGALFTSARLDGTIDIGTFSLPDGSLFTADSLAFVSTLLPSNGIGLTPGDFATIDLSGVSTTPAPVPEPSSLALIAGGLSLLYGHRRRRTGTSRGRVVQSES